MDMCHLGIRLALIFLVYQWKSVQSASFMTFPEAAVPKNSNGTYVLNYGACFCGIENLDSKELTARPKAHFRTELFIECNPKGINICQNRCKNETETLVSLLCLKSGHLESTKGHLYYNFCAAPKWERVGVSTQNPFCCHNNLPSDCATLPKLNNTVQIPQTTHPTVEVKEVQEGTPVTENQLKENTTTNPSEENARRNSGEDKPFTEHHLNTNTTHYLSDHLRKSSTEDKPLTEHHLNTNTTHYLSEHLRKSSTEDKPLTAHHLKTNTTHNLNEHFRRNSQDDKPVTDHHLKTNTTHNFSEHFRRNSNKTAAEVKPVTNLEKPATSKSLESTTEKLNVTSLKNESTNTNKTNATALNTTEPVVNKTTLPTAKPEGTVAIQNKTASNNITNPTSSGEISGHSNESKTTKQEAATNTSKSINSNVTAPKSVSPAINTSSITNQKNVTSKDIKNVTLTHRHASSTTNENVTVTNKTAATTATPAVNSTPTIQEAGKGNSTQANLHNTVNGTSTLKETNVTNGKATNLTSGSSPINATLAPTNATLAVNKTTNATAVKEVKNENTTQIKVPQVHQRSSHHKMLIDYSNETVVQANILNTTSSPNNGSKNGTNTQTTGALNEIKNKIVSPTVASVNATENSTTNIKKESSTDPIALTTNKTSENNSVALKKTEVVNGTASKTNITRGARSMAYPSTNNSDEEISAANPDHSKVNLELLYSRYLEIPLTSRKSFANTSETNNTKPLPQAATAPNTTEHTEYASENFASRTLKSLDGKNTVPNNSKLNATISANNSSATNSTTKATTESSFRIHELQTQKITPNATLKDILNKTQTVTPNVIQKEVLNKTQTVTPNSNIPAINNLSTIKNTPVKSAANGTVVNGSGRRNSLPDHLSKRDISFEELGITDYSRSVKSIQKEDIQTGSQFSDSFIASTKGPLDHVSQTTEFTTSTPATTVNKFKTKLPAKKWETENPYGNWKLDTGAARNKESTTTPITANKEFGNGTNTQMNIPYPNTIRPGNRTREPKIPRPLLQNEGIKAIPTATTTAATAPINLSDKPTLLSANIPKINYHPSMMQSYFHPQNKPQGSLRQLE